MTQVHNEAFRAKLSNVQRRLVLRYMGVLLPVIVTVVLVVVVVDQRALAQHERAFNMQHARHAMLIEQAIQSHLEHRIQHWQALVQQEVATFAKGEQRATEIATLLRVEDQSCQCGVAFSYFEASDRVVASQAVDSVAGQEAMRLTRQWVSESWPILGDREDVVVPPFHVTREFQMLGMIFPVREENELRGAFAVVIDLHSIAQQYVIPMSESLNSAGSLVDGQNLVIHDNDRELVGRYIFDAISDSSEVATLSARIKAEPAGVGSYTRATASATLLGQRRERVLLAWDSVRVGDQRLGIVLSAPAAEVNSVLVDLNHQRHWIRAFSVLSLIVFSIFFFRARQQNFIQNLEILEQEVESRTADLRASEASLRESEERFSLALEATSNALWDWNLLTNEAYFSPYYYEMLGYEPYEFPACYDAWVNLLHPEDREHAESVVSDHVGRGEMFEVEFRLRTKAGHWCWILGRGKVMAWDENHQPRRVIGTHIDITDRKQSEEALRRSEERFRGYFNLDLLGMAISSPERKWLEVNDRLCQILGYTQEALVGKDWLTLTHPDDVRSSSEQFERALAGEVDSYVTEKRYLKKNGDTVCISLATRCIRLADGSVDYFLTLVQDITDRKRVEIERERLLQQNRQQAQQLQQIIEAVPEGVLLLDADAYIVHANPEAQRALSILTNSGVGEALSHLGDQRLDEFLTSPPKGLEHIVEVQGPPYYRFGVIARPIEAGPTPGGWVLVIRDVTEAYAVQQRRQQQERLAAVGQLAAGIAHDFNNIMAVIVLYAQMASRSPGLSASVYERLDTISGQANRATELINQILDFGRHDELERRSLDLLSFVKELVKLLRRTLPEDIEIVLKDGGGAFLVDADLTRIQQVLMNLAFNARDAMPQGGELIIGLERLKIESRRDAPLPELNTGDWLRLKVSDTGVGIAPDVLPRIFDPFFTTKARGQGTGLGLAQVRGIVAAHGGVVSVESQVGVGTTFFIYLPALLASRSEVASPQALETLGGGDGETLLVVEDDVQTRTALVQGLEFLNYRVLTASNGREALAILDASCEKIDLVLSDVVMPEMGGIALFHAMRERGFAIDVILLTGHPLKQELEGLRAHGLKDWLLKPPSLEQLAEVVSRALSSSAG